MSDKTEAKVHRAIAAAISSAAAKDIRPDMSLRLDLHIDSVGLMTLAFLVEQETGIDAFSRVQEFVAAESVADIVAIVRRAQGLMV